MAVGSRRRRALGVSDVASRSTAISIRFIYTLPWYSSAVECRATALAFTRIVSATNRYRLLSCTLSIYVVSMFCKSSYRHESRHNSHRAAIPSPSTPPLFGAGYRTIQYQVFRTHVLGSAAHTWSPLAPALVSRSLPSYAVASYSDSFPPRADYRTARPNLWEHRAQETSGPVRASRRPRHATAKRT